jgi:hypothetical protein
MYGILNPSLSVEAKNIAGMQPQQALQYLTNKGLPMSLAIACLQNAQMQQVAKTQQAIHSVMGPKPPITQQVEQAFNQQAGQATQQSPMAISGDQADAIRQAVAQHAADEARHGGLADLPVSPDMYSFSSKKMAKGGIVAFSGKDDDQQVKSVANQAQTSNDAILNAAATYGTPLGYLQALQGFNAGVKNFADRLNFSGAPTSAGPPKSDAQVWAEYNAQNQGIFNNPKYQQQVRTAAAQGQPAQVGPGTPVTGFEQNQQYDYTTPTAMQLMNQQLSGQLEDVFAAANQKITPPTGAPVPMRPAIPPANEIDPNQPAGKTPLARLALRATGQSDPYQELMDHLQRPQSPLDRFKAMKDVLGTNKAAGEYSSYLNDLSEKVQQSADSQMKMAKAAAFFNMAAAAGKPGQAGNGLTKFLNAAAEGGISYTQAVPHIQQGLMAMQQNIAADKFRLADAQRREDSDLYRDAEREYSADMRNYSANINDLTKARISEHYNTIRLQIQEDGLNSRAQKNKDMLDAQLSRMAEGEKRTAISVGAKNAEGALHSAQLTLQQLQTSFVDKNSDEYKQAKANYDRALVNYYGWNSSLMRIGGIDIPADSNQAASKSGWGISLVKPAQ